MGIDKIGIHTSQPGQNVEVSKEKVGKSNFGSVKVINKAFNPSTIIARVVDTAAKIFSLFKSDASLTTSPVKNDPMREAFKAGGPNASPVNSPFLPPMPEGSTLLMQVIKWGDPELAAQMIKSGANLRAVDKEGNSVMYHALYSGKEEIVRAMLGQGFGANSPIDDQGTTPLHYLAQRSSSKTELIKLFIDAGADIERKNSKGETPLMKACNQFVHYNTGAAEVLIKAGAKVDVKNSQGMTPLQNILARNMQNDEIAIKYQAQIADLLLSNGASKNVVVPDSSNPDTLAGRFKGATVKELMENARQDSTFMDPIAAKHGL